MPHVQASIDGQVQRIPQSMTARAWAATPSTVNIILTHDHQAALHLHMFDTVGG
jgi:hypothetical protein